MLNFPVEDTVNAEPTLTKGARDFFHLSESLASGFGLEPFIFININWTNVDQRNNTYSFLYVVVLTLSICS